MTTVPPALVADPLDAVASPRAGAWSRLWAVVEGRLIALADRANPILVKETRQALKSRQFVVTFLIVLVACWIVSFAGVAIIGPQIYYGAAGPQMLVAYYAILAFPLALIVPFSAFRSLASEQEDNTYDLLSITTLSSKQIVSGKLSSAIVQMLVYVCAVSPCIAFTFLLRGVDALTVGFLLAVAILGSLGLSMIALVVGAVARVRNTQVVISVALVLGLAGMFAAAVSLGAVILEEGSSFLRDWEFWVITGGLLTIYVTTFGLLHAAAASQISFFSENRATPLRRWMMAQQACFCGWLGAMLYAAREFNNMGSGSVIPEFIMVGAGLASFYWYVMGALMTGEWPHLSRRVQRSLPQTTMGRTFFTLFNPGPGAGYMFAVANLTALVVVGLVLLVLVDTTGRTWRSVWTVVCFLVLVWAYVVAFLGLGRLLINLLRKWMYVPMAAAFLLHAVLLLTAVGVPTVIQVASRRFQNEGYSLLQMSNPFWTLGELADGGAVAVQAEILMLAIPTVAIAVLLLNMRSIVGEFLLHRIAPPDRVIEEEAALHPAPAPRPSSPWELDEQETSDSA